MMHLHMDLTGPVTLGEYISITVLAVAVLLYVVLLIMRRTFAQVTADVNRVRPTLALDPKVTEEIASQRRELDRLILDVREIAEVVDSHAAAAAS